MTGANQQIRFRDYLRVVVTRRWIVYAALAVAALAAALYVFVKTPVYRAEATILIEPAKVNITDFKAAYDPNFQLGGEFGRREYYETQYQLLVNRTLLERTYGEFGFASFKDFSGQEEPVEKFSRLFGVHPLRRSRLVKVTFEWRDPELAARVLGYLVDQYILDHRNRTLGVTTLGLDALRKKAAQLRPQMERKAAELEEFVARTDMVSLEKTENIIIDRLKEISRNLSETERKRIEYESIYTNITEALRDDRPIEDMPEVHLSAPIRDLKLEYIRTKQDFSELVKRFGPRHPEVVAAIARLKTIANKLEQEIQSTRETTLAQLDRARRQEEGLRKELKDQEARVLSLNKMAARYNLLRDSYETQKKTFQALAKRIEEVEVTMAAGSKNDNIFIITEPRVPARPVKPQRGVILVLASAGGLLLGLALCFVLDHFDTRIRGKEDVEDLLGTSVLGYVPAVKGIGRRSFGLRKGFSEVLILDQDRSAAAEAFRSIRTAVLFSGMNGSVRSLQVTSSLPREGKTLICINVAAVLARAGKKVLLIDADMRKPRLHKVLGIPHGRGLSDLLTGDGSLGLEDAARPVGNIEGLDCMPCGSIPPNPAELLGGPGMKELLEEAQRKYDMVVVDTPPVINVTDPVVLSRLVQGTIVVVRTYSTQSELARRSMELLAQAKANVLGVVLNNIDIPRHGYYGYGGQYYQQKEYYGDYDLKKAGRRAPGPKVPPA